MFKWLNQVKERFFKWIAVVLIVALFSLLYLKDIIPSLQGILIDTRIIDFLVLAFVLDGGYYLIKLNEKIDRAEKIKVYKNQPSASMEIINYIMTQKPKKADLIEYSSATAYNILLSLKNVGSEIRLLIAHPDTAVSETQKKRIINRIESLLKIDFNDYKKIQIRCYSAYPTSKDGEKNKIFPSITGRKFDEKYICLSWYTPTDKIEGGIVGHDNPLICGTTDNEHGMILSKHFDEVFNFLWKNSEPIDKAFEKYCKEDVQQNIGVPGDTEVVSIPPMSALTRESS